MSNRVVHFEIPADDTAQLKQFFSDVFNWTFHELGDRDYWMATTGDDGQPGINGAIMKKVGEGQPVINSISVADIDAAIEKVAAHGGKIVKPKFAVAHTGWLAFFADPEGNMHGLWQDDSSAL